MAALVILAVGLSFIVVLWLLYRPRSNLPSPDSPPGHFIMGNLLDFLKPRPELLLTKWSEEIGIVYSVRLLFLHFVVVNDYDSIYTVLVKQGKEFAGRAGMKANRVRYVFDCENSIVMAPPTKQWKFLRQMVHSNVKMYEKGLRRVESVSMTAIEDLMTKMSELGGQSAFNPRSIIYNATMNIICVFLLGRTFPQDDPFFLLAREVEIESIKYTSFGADGTELDAMWCLRFFPNKTFKRLQHLVQKREKLWKLAREMVNQDLEDESNYDGGIIHDLLIAITQKKNSVPDYIDEKNAKAVFLDIILAGMTTTSNSFYSFLNIMLWYPDVLAKLRGEVDEVVGADRAVSFEDRQTMPYTRATIIELTRYSSVAPMGVPHEAVVDTSINGYQIPKGTPIMTNLWALHHDEKFWGDPWEFRPERFLDDQGEVLPPDDERRRHVLAFGAGPRVCLGETLAVGRLFLLIATVVQRFEWLPGDAKVSCDPREYDSGAAICNSDFKVRFVRREQVR